MRFTGQVKIPDLDFPGLPAEVLVEDKQTELFVEGESIGRWSLVDVRAERLISSAFSLKLAGEEVTFLADQPTEFAYNGVDLMANVWARHKAMSFPLRVIATSRSRKGTKPSRIEDLREAIKGALSGNTLNALSGQARGGAQAPVEPSRTSILEAPARHEPTPLPGEDESTEASRPYRPATPVAPVAGDRVDHRAAPADLQAAADLPEAADLPAAAAPVEPSQVTPVPEEGPSPEAAPLPDTPVTDSVFKDAVPWASHDSVPVPGANEPTSLPDPDDQPEDATHTDPVAIDVPAVAPPDVDTPVPRRDVAVPPEPGSSRPAPPSASVPWMAPPPDGSPSGEREQASAAELPAAEPHPDARPKYVVDLGAFEDHDDRDGLPKQGRRARQARPEQRPPAVDAPALATTAGRSGIMGAVRGAFVRTRTEHEHDYVEAPGGLGIKRQICADCGHISIGVSE